MVKVELIPLCICATFAFFGFWTLFSIIGAIHYSVWYPRFDLKDMHIRGFNVTPTGELSYDMDILIETRHFSAIRRIEQYSYEVRTSHVGTRIGASSVPGFHPIHNKTMTISTTQRASLMPLEPSLGALMRADLNATGRVALRVYIEGQIYTSLFLAQKSRVGWTCDLIVSPAKPFGSQIYDRLCCDLQYQTPNCCKLPPSSLSSTISICG